MAGVLFVSTASAQSPAQCGRVFAEDALPPALEQVLNRVTAAGETFFQYIKGSSRVYHSYDESFWRSAPRRALQFIYNTPLAMLNPTPIPVQRLLPWDAPANPIFEKLWRDASYKPSAAEMALLKKHQLEDSFQKRQQFLLDRPRWHRTNMILEDSARMALAVAFFLQLYISSESGEHLVTADAYLNEPGATDENRVEIFFETTPGPHLALRVGSSVYSYGRDTSVISSLKDYLVRSPIPPMGLIAKVSSTVDPDIPRSIQVVELRATAEQAQILKKEMNVRRQNVDRNLWIGRETSSTIAFALSHSGIIDLPVGVDLAPASILQYLGILKLKGDARIGSLRQIHFVKDESRLALLGRSFFVNAMDTKIWLGNILLNLPKELTLNALGATGVDPEQKEILEAVREYRAVIATSVRSSVGVQELEALVRAVPPEATANERAQARTILASRLKVLRKPLEITLKSRTQDALTTERAKESLLVLADVESELNARLNAEAPLAKAN